MKKFNKDIQVTISADQIANRFLETIKEDNPHRELIAETVLSVMISNDNYHALGHLVNSLGGWEPVLNFEIGKTYKCTQSIWIEYYPVIEGQEIPTITDVIKIGNRVEMGICKVVNIDPYKSNNQIQVEFMSINSMDKVKIETLWVNKETVKEFEDIYYTFDNVVKETQYYFDSLSKQV